MLLRPTNYLNHLFRWFGSWKVQYYDFFCNNTKIIFDLSNYFDSSKKNKINIFEVIPWVRDNRYVIICVMINFTMIVTHLFIIRVICYTNGKQLTIFRVIEYCSDDLFGR